MDAWYNIYFGTLCTCGRCILDALLFDSYSAESRLILRQPLSHSRFGEVMMMAMM
jgi:hypothetical protein